MSDLQVFNGKFDEVYDSLGRPVIYYGEVPYYVGQDAQGFIHRDSIGEFIFVNQIKRYWRGVFEKIDDGIGGLLGKYGFFLLKPDTYQRSFEENIVSLFIRFGGTISLKKEVILTEDMIVRLYPYFFDFSFFHELVQYLSSGKSCAFLVRGVTSSQELLQFRQCVRERYCDNPTDPLHNLIHVPDAKKDMLRAMQIFFSSDELAPFL